MTPNETRFRVRYAETDQMGIVYYANYLIWMEVGRSEYCRATGLRYRDMEQADGIRLAVVDARCRYISPARYDDEILVQTSIREANRRLIEFHYEIWEAVEGRRLATGETRHVFLGPENKPMRLPDKYHSYFGLGVKSIA
jgi:acyl-CoA thioester hydrolase